MTLNSRSGDPVGRWLIDLTVAAQWHRRLLAAGLLAGSMAFGLHALAPPPPPTVAVVSAARDLPAGSTLAAADLAVARVDPAHVPDGTLSRPAQARGRTLVAAARRGELLTDVRLVGHGLLADLDAGLVATPVRIADADSVRLLRPGSVVDVLAAGGAGDTTEPARLVASAVRVLTVPRADDAALGRSWGDGAMVLLGTTPSTAARLAGAAVSQRLSVVVRR